MSISVYTYADFNPRSPRGGATPPKPVVFPHPLISIHAPREGERRAPISPILPMSISIHAPREGERLSEVRGLRVCDIFQSTLPARGSDHANAQRVRARKISIHAPREGERLCRHVKTRAYLYHFNPRSPRGGATVDAQFKLLGKKNFNPRSPRGGATRRELNGLVL